jgi:parvulin-like peptidyl-prolyl isomerase
MRAAFQRALALRREWEAGGDFGMLEQQFSHPFATPASMPDGFFRRGAALPTVERAAFCLPLHEISPPILAEDGFHLIEVLEAR